MLFSDLHGDLPRPLPKIDELKGATDITERKGSPSWDYDVCILNTLNIHSGLVISLFIFSILLLGSCVL